MDEVAIEVRENGPYLVRGAVRVVDQEGREFICPPGSAVAFCRCGHSGNKPFCDGSHKKVGFSADDAAPRLG
jgi:CDGSH-type Zn-finger protein